MVVEIERILILKIKRISTHREFYGMHFVICGERTFRIFSIKVHILRRENINEKKNDNIIRHNMGFQVSRKREINVTH